MVGGVVNMFLQLPRCLEAYYEISRETDVQKQEPLVARFRAAVCEYFVYILAAPFLGIVLYGLMAAADYTNVWILGVMACSVGFMSSRIVELLVSFSTQILDRLRSPKEKQEDDTGKSSKTPAELSRDAGARPTMPP
jgi:hypothetical protein